MGEPTKIVPNEQDEKAKVTLYISYGMMLLGLISGIFFIVGFIWALVKKDEIINSMFSRHFENIQFTFWVGLGLTIIGFLTTLILIGWFILFFAYIWVIYRLLKGLANLTSCKDFF